jgi:DDE family transposase
MMKHGKSRFGYKLSIKVDKKYEFIRRTEIDPASRHDSQRFDKVFVRAMRAGTSMLIAVIHPGTAKPRSGKGLSEAVQRKGKRNKRVVDVMSLSVLGLSAVRLIFDVR